ncbi:MAG: FxLYD domain-containing protein [Dehalococcoidia bacterium]|nr:FxLYD domain-containing protein [Dehalococcoidia bacterium]MDD5494836.1 FxLYD domain-containing protein [Dehalococcoidia bacterium]
MPPKILISLIMPLAVICLLSASCAAGPNLQVVEHSIIVREFTADTSRSTATVTGAAENTGDRPARSCNISVTFYDYVGGIVGVKEATKEQVLPGEVWNFTIELKGKESWNVADYKISAISK